MSNISMILEEKATSIGNFLVGRLLPFRQKRSVGPFVFIDHMGPASMKDNSLEVPPHPHIGLSTLTFLFEGSVMHRDSIGSAIEITPGAVNWMTAGKGVVHSERTPERLKGTDSLLHGLQIWVAMPKEMENDEPSFTHVAAEDIPAWKIGNADVRLVAGTAFGKASPVPVLSPLYFIEIKTKEAQQLNIGKDLYGESGLYILEGAVTVEGNTYGPRQILITQNAELCAFETTPGTTVYIFGGAPFPEERFIMWNFVSTSRETIEKAKEDWQAQRFPIVPGETDFVPLP